MIPFNCKYHGYYKTILVSPAILAVVERKSNADTVELVAVKYRGSESFRGLRNIYFDHKDLDPIREEVGFIKVVDSFWHGHFVNEHMDECCGKCFSEAFGISVLE